MSAWLAAGAAAAGCALACGVVDVEAAGCAGGEADVELSVFWSAITRRRGRRKIYVEFGSGSSAKQPLFLSFCCHFVPSMDVSSILGSFGPTYAPCVLLFTRANFLLAAKTTMILRKVTIF